MTYVIIFLLIAVVLLAIYLYPPPRASFQEIYARVPEPDVQSLQAFRQKNKLSAIRIEDRTWSYLVLGDGPETIVLLHGMGGAYDIWWKIIDHFKDRYRLLSVTYPPVDSLAGLSNGILQILQKEKISNFHLVGSSLGGYLAQYLVARHPGMISRAIFANTFPPNDIIAQKTKTLGTLLPLLPAWMVMQNFRKTIRQSIYPAANNSELVAAYLMEQACGAMSKAQFVSRYRCVIDYFEPPDPGGINIPVMIIEADNDPLVEQRLREMLKATYPSAIIRTLHHVGHFPYLNQPEPYIGILENFFE